MVEVERVESGLLVTLQLVEMVAIQLFKVLLQAIVRVGEGVEVVIVMLLGYTLSMEVLVVEGEP